MASYTYSKANDTASGNVEINVLQEEVYSSLPDIAHINLSGDDLEIHFSTSLSTGDESTLTTIVSNHQGVILNSQKIPKMIQQVDINKTLKNKNTYRSMSKIIYYGSNSIGEITTIEVVAYMQSGVDSFDIRVVDRKNGSNVIAEKTGLTNTDDEIIDLGTISNLPTDKTRLEVQIRKNDSSSSTNVYLDTILIKY